MSEYDDERFNLNIQDANDVMNVIQFHGIDKDGLHWLDWFKRIQSGDALHNIVLFIVRNRKDPKYAELVNELEAEIEGWL
jgi:hypothetical protein